MNFCELLRVVRFVTYAYFKFSSDLIMSHQRCTCKYLLFRGTTTTDPHGFAYKKKGDTGTRTVEICREGCEGVLLLPILRYLSYLSYLRSVHSPSKKEDPRTTTTAGRRRNRYAKDNDHGFPPRNIPKGARRDPNQHTSHLLFI